MTRSFADHMRARPPCAVPGAAGAAVASNPDTPFVITKATQAVLDAPAIALLHASFAHVEI